MKQKLSITVDEATIKLIERTIKDGLFRNKSHVVEFSLNKILNIKNLSGDFCGSKILEEEKIFEGD